MRSARAIAAVSLAASRAKLRIGLERLAGVADEDDQLAGGHRALGDAQDADDGDDRGGEGAQHADGAVEAGLQPRDLDADAHPLLAAAAHPLGLHVLGAEGLHDGHRADSASLAMLARSPSWRRCLRARSRTLRRKTKLMTTSSGAVIEAEQREDRVDPQQHERHAEREQRGLEHLAERVAEQLAHVVDVLGDAGEQVALGRALVVGEAEPLQVVVDRDPQLVGDPLARWTAATGR